MRFSVRRVSGNSPSAPVRAGRRVDGSVSATAPIIDSVVWRPVIERHLQPRPDAASPPPSPRRAGASSGAGDAHQSGLQPGRQFTGLPAPREAMAAAITDTW